MGNNYLINDLPNDILDSIFLLLSGQDLTQCLLVCKRWLNLIDNKQFWIQKCLRNKNLIKCCTKQNIVWKQKAKLIYLSNFFDRNLLKNSRGNKYFNDWCILNENNSNNISSILNNYNNNLNLSYSNEKLQELIEYYKQNKIKSLKSSTTKCLPVSNWRVEIMPSSGLANNDSYYIYDSFKTKGFGEKFQIIDLAQEGYCIYPHLLNEIKPDIEIYEYYRVHNSQCCEYYLTVLLISDTFQLIDSYFYRDKTEQIHSDWKCVYYKFLNSSLDKKELVRFILFYHAGRVIILFDILIIVIKIADSDFKYFRLIIQICIHKKILAL